MRFYTAVAAQEETLGLEALSLRLRTAGSVRNAKVGVAFGD